MPSLQLDLAAADEAGAGRAKVAHGINSSSDQQRPLGDLDPAAVLYEAILDAETSKHRPGGRILISANEFWDSRKTTL